MDQTPTKPRNLRASDMIMEDQENARRSANSRMKKPPPITPRRFNKFFTPRPRDSSQAVRTSRNALKAISGSNLNVRQQNNSQDQDEGYLPANENIMPRKKRRYSAYSAASTPQAMSDVFLPSSQEPLPSSPLRRHGLDQDDMEIASDEETDRDEDLWPEQEITSRVQRYSTTSTSRNLLSRRLGTRERVRVAENSNLWQHETDGYYSNATDICSDFRQQTSAALPFSMAACHTNPVVATGDEEGYIRLHDTSNSSRDSDAMQKVLLKMRPHDNALMDLTFSSDDMYLATGSGDQTCQIIDVQAQQSLYSLRAHTASVKRVQFQPGTGDKLLASCGRDGVICVWDLRTHNRSVPTRFRPARYMVDTTEEVPTLSPVITIHNAHSVANTSRTAGGRPTTVPGRLDFSITSLAFLNESKNHYLASASEVDTVIKVWDLRAAYTTIRKPPTPVTVTQEPPSHKFHRKFGINSVVLNTTGSRLYALSRDHTVYAYSTSHLILGSAPPEPPSTRKSTFRIPESAPGLGSIYAFRHPSLRVSSFWPRLAIRKATNTTPELLAVASTDESPVLFPTNEKYLTSSARQVPTLHDPNNGISPVAARSTNPSGPTPPIIGTTTIVRSHRICSRVERYGRPTITRTTTSSFTSLFTASGRAQNDAESGNLPVFYHGTPLVRGHVKEVTSLQFTSEGNLCTASDDYSVRCWREDGERARECRKLEGERDAGGLWRRGWASVGVEGWDAGLGDEEEE